MSLQHGYECVPSFEAVWRAFVRDQTRTLMPVMTAAGYVSLTLRSHWADSTLFSPPPEQEHPPKKKAKVRPPPQQPVMGRQPPAPVAMSPPSRPVAPPWHRPGLRLRSMPRTRPCSRQRRWFGLPKGRQPTHRGCQAAERGGTDSPSTSPQGVHSRGPLRALVMALLPHPAPPQVRTLSNVLSNLFRDAPPPTPASPRQQGLGPEGLDPVCLRFAAWYQRPAAGGPAGWPACGSQEVLHLPAAGD